MKYFVRENWEVFEIEEKNYNEKEFEKEYKIYLWEETLFIDKDIKKIKPFVKYLLNSKKEDLKDLFITFILFISALSLIIAFLSFNNINKLKNILIEKWAIIQVKKETTQNKKTQKIYIDIEENKKEKEKVIWEARGGSGY